MLKCQQLLNIRIVNYDGGGRKLNVMQSFILKSCGSFGAVFVDVGFLLLFFGGLFFFFLGGGYDLS